MWLFTHSNSFQKIPLTPPINLQAKLLFFDEKNEKNREEEVKILTFLEHRCFIQIENELSLSSEQHILLNFELKGKTLTCGALIEDTLVVNEQVIYQLIFNFLDPETKNTLFSFQSEKNQKVKRQNKKSTV